MMVAMTADPTVERLTAAIHQLTAMLEVAGRTPPLDRCTEEEQRAKERWTETKRRARAGEIGPTPPDELTRATLQRIEKQSIDLFSKRVETALQRQRMDFIEQRTAVFEAVKYGAEIVGDVGAFMGGAKSIGSDFLTKVAEGVVEVIAKAWPDVAKRMGARMSLVVNAIKAMQPGRRKGQPKGHPTSSDAVEALMSAIGFDAGIDTLKKAKQRRKKTRE